MERNIAVIVLVAQFVERAPCTEVRPAEVGRQDEDILRFLHYAVVDTDIGASREDTLDKIVLAVGTHIEVSLAELLHNLGEETMERRVDSAQVPKEDTGVPQELAALHKDLCQFEVGFLGKSLHFADALGIVLHILHLDIAVAGLGACRFHTEGKDGIVLLYE